MRGGQVRICTRRYLRADLMMTGGRGPSPTKPAVARGVAAPMNARQQGRFHVRAVLLQWRAAQIRTLNLFCTPLSAAAFTSATPPSAHHCPVAVQTTSLVACPPPPTPATLSPHRSSSLSQVSLPSLLPFATALAPVPSFLPRPTSFPLPPPTLPLLPPALVPLTVQSCPH